MRLWCRKIVCHGVFCSYASCNYAGVLHTISLAPPRRSHSNYDPTRDTAQMALQDRLSSMGGVMTDAAVPEGHAGLHGFLYGDGGAEAHDSAGYSFREVREPGSAGTVTVP